MKKKTAVFISASPSALRKALERYARTATVEAEYGSILVEGTVATLAHHVDGAKHNPPPCLYEDLSYLGKIDAIGISHLDVDTIGGIMALLGKKRRDLVERNFWLLSAKVDIEGLHTLESLENFFPKDVVERYYCARYLLERFPVKAPADGSAANVTEQVMFIISQFSNRVLSGNFLQDDELRERGREIRNREKILNKTSLLWVENCGDFTAAVRQSSVFVNHLYSLPDGQKADIVLAHNRENGMIVLSSGKPINGFNCAEILQEIYGEEAGGHETIAGTPRSLFITEEQAEKEMERIMDRVRQKLEQIQERGREITPCFP